MSWSAECEVKSDESIENAISELIAHGQQTLEMREQFRQAKEVALSIVHSDVIGKGAYIVRLSGHANPKHEFTEGYANDYVSVTISRMVDF